jgi:integrase
VVQLTAKDRPEGRRFVVKDYPKDREWRRLGLAPHLVIDLTSHIRDHRRGMNDLLFPMPVIEEARRYVIPEMLPDPLTLGWTEPNEQAAATSTGRRQPMARAAAAAGTARTPSPPTGQPAARPSRDAPRRPRTVATDSDRHIGRGWFRTNVWLKAVKASGISFHVTPHGLRHAHASWLLAGGANVQVVKERLGHASITTTEKYLHTLPTADQAALGALDAIRRPREAAE